MANSWPISGGLAGLRERALTLLRAVEEGRPAGAIVRSLALDVLRGCVPDSPPWVLAVSVLEGDALKMRHAVEMAGWLVEAIGEAEDGRRDVSA